MALPGAKMLFERRGPKLPYDAEVEYIMNTSGTYNLNGVSMPGSVGSYIDTGILPTSNSRVEVKFSFLSGFSQYAYQTIFGGYDSNQRNFGIVARGSYTYILCGGQSNTRFVTYKGDTLYEMTFDALLKKLTVNGTNANFTNGFSGSSNAHVTLFTNSAVGSLSAYETSYTFKGSIYFFRYFVGDELLHDLIPIRFTNELGQSEGAMYDRANPTVGMNPDGSPRTDGLYRNRGTGAFLYGADKTA